MSAQTVTRWVADGGWGTGTKSPPTSPARTRQQDIEQHQRAAAGGPAANPSPEKTAASADKLVKFAATVERLDKKTSVVDVIEVFMAFSKWLQYRMSFDPNVTPELLKTINHYHDLFISEKLKESFNA